MAKGGKRPGAGRKAGVPNKLTMDVKQTIMEAFEKLGGVNYLVKVGKKEPKVFCALLARIVPQETKTEVKQGPTLVEALKKYRKMKQQKMSNNV